MLILNALVFHYRSHPDDEVDDILQSIIGAGRSIPMFRTSHTEISEL